MPALRSTKKQLDTPVVVVAGAAGFLGSHLTESLLQSGVKVLGLDDLVTGSMSNIASFRRHSNFEFFECNVNQTIPAAIFNRPITHIVHAMGIDTHSLDKNATLASLLTGSFGTKNLLDLAVKSGATFVLASSINVYEGLASSTSLHHYFGSTDSQKARYSHYESKRYAEGLCQMYASEYNLDVRVARLSSVYGPRMDLCDSSFLDRMIKKTLDGVDLEVEEDGNQEVYLTYVDDVVFGLSKLLFAEGEHFPQSIYPLVGSDKTSIISVAYTLRTFLPPGKEVKFLAQSRQADFALPVISFDRVKKDLDWEPEVSLTDGLRMTIEAFRKGTSQPIRQHKIGREQLSTIPAIFKEDKPEPPESKARAVAAVRIHDGEVDPIENRRTEHELVSLVVPRVVNDGQTKSLPFRGAVKSIEIEPITEHEPRIAKTVKPAVNVKPIGSTNQEGKGLVKVVAKAPRWWRRLLFAAVLVGLYVAIGRPIVHTTVQATSGGIALRQAVASAKQLDFDKAAQSFKQSQAQFAQARESAHFLAWSANLVGLGSSQKEVESALAALSVSSDGLATLSQVAAPWPEQLKSLLQFKDPPTETVDVQQLASQAKVGLRQSKKQFGQAMSLLSGSSTSQVAGASIVDGQESIGSPGLFAGVLQQARGLLAQAQSYLGQAEQLVEILPSALAANGQKSYLLVFQNSNELRPTGGFMGSYALIQVDKGRITSFKVDDIYNPDGQLQSDLTAPGPLNKQLGASSLFLRDANWSADVPESSRLIAELYEQATKQSVDGVFFVTTKAINPLLSALGPIHLANFNETVTADNFDMLAQTHSNVGFVPGSTNKRDFLGLLSEAVLARIEQGGAHDWLVAGKAIGQGLQQKEIQLYFSDPAIALLVDQQDWSGRTKASSGDYLRVVDANIGANKSNYYVQRSTDYSVNVDRDSHLNGVVKINWTHSGTSGTWPGGDYVNYVRIYVPLNSKLIGGRYFDNELIDTFIEDDKQVFGGYVTVPYNSQKSVEVSYTLPSQLGLLENNGDYELLWQKQSGLGDEPVVVRFNTPAFLAASQISGTSTEKQDSIIWQKNAPADQIFSLRLERR